MRTASEQPRISMPAARAHNPLLYELNTRCWLRQLTETHGRPITLANVPDAEFHRWRELGFTHIWLMGVWTTGPQSRQQALDDVELLRQYREFFGGQNTTDLLASPFAIAEYSVAPTLGGDAGLRKFRHKLHLLGLKLILDFVPNHVGLDHPWLREHPEFFVHSDDEFPEAFHVHTRRGDLWIAHGKDPNFFSWIDTAQLDYRAPETREAMQGLLAALADRCDGLRCDMAMLLLNPIFARNWSHVPSTASPPETEFWSDAVTEIRLNHPTFLFLGEVYWGMEDRLQEIGFDYTYDKHLYDLLLQHRHEEVQAYLLDKGTRFIHRCAHFIENHDEPRAAAQLSLPEHRAVALAAFGLPGLRMIHEGELAGARLKVPVYFGRRPVEPVNGEVESLYDYLLAALSISSAGKGRSEILAPAPAWPDNATAVNLVLILWQSAPSEFDLVTVNLAPHSSQGQVVLPVDDLATHDWEMKDLLGEEHYERRGDELAARGLYLDLKPYAAQIFHFKPRGYSESYLAQHAARF